MTSPYEKKDKSKWEQITKKLVDKHPLKDQLVDLVFKSWKSIFNSSFDGFQIGKDFFPEPQIMGFFLHDLIALHLHNANADYELGSAGNEKDIECRNNSKFSIEIKTSSHKNQIFANRSYAQPNNSSKKKTKDGYFLAVNFERFPKNKAIQPNITLIRFGYLEHTDWIAQKAATGQQARLSTETYGKKFITLYNSKTSAK